MLYKNTNKIKIFLKWDKNVFKNITNKVNKQINITQFELTLDENLYFVFIKIQ